MVTLYKQKKSRFREPSNLSARKSLFKLQNGTHPYSYINMVNFRITSAIELAVDNEWLCPEKYEQT